MIVSFTPLPRPSRLSLLEVSSMRPSFDPFPPSFAVSVPITLRASSNVPLKAFLAYSQKLISWWQ
jgi:hypothetical protein